MSQSEAPGEVIAYELHGNCYLNITYQCTLRCAFCPKFNGVWEVQGYNLRIHTEPSAEQIVAAVGDVGRYNEVVFCGLGESTLRLDVMLDVARELKKQGAKIRLNTDGLANLVHERDVTPEFAGLIDAVSISMNADNETVYEQHCRPKSQYPGAYQAMLQFAAAVSHHVPEVSMTAIDGLEGVNIERCREQAERIGVAFRRRVLDVVG